MGVMLAIWGLCAAAFGMFVLASARSAVHEIEAGIAFLVATVALGLTALLEELKKCGMRLEERGKERPPRPSSLAEKQLAELERDFLSEKIGPDEYRRLRKHLSGE